MRVLPNLLRSLGYNVDVRSSIIEQIKPTAKSIVPDSAFRALWGRLTASTVRRQLCGNLQIAAHLTEFVKALDRILHGSDANAV